MLNDLIQNEYAIVIIGAVAVISVIIAIVSIAMTVSIRKKYRKIMVDGAGKDITEAIIQYYEKCTKLMDEMRKSEKRIETLERNMVICGQKIGCYRYNAFNDSKANLSYALAVLDATNSGFVMNGVFSRQQTITYMKPIENGKSKYELTDEEQHAIQIALYRYDKQMESEQQEA